MKLLGIPVIYQMITVAPKGTSIVANEYMLVPVGVPDKVYKVLVSGRYGKIAVTPLNAIEQMLMHDGLVKDVSRKNRPYVVEGAVVVPVWGGPGTYDKGIVLYEIKRSSGG